MKVKEFMEICGGYCIQPKGKYCYGDCDRCYWFEPTKEEAIKSNNERSDGEDNDESKN